MTKRFVGLGAVIAAGLLSVLAALSLTIFSVGPGRPAAVVFSPETSEEDTLRAVVMAGGLPVRETRLALWSGVVWVVMPDDPAFFDRVKKLGALAVINPLALGGCLLEAPR